MNNNSIPETIEIKSDKSSLKDSYSSLNANFASTSVTKPKDAHSLEKKIFKQVGKAIGDFNLIEEGDHILVGVSGGKDSWALLYVLNEMSKRAPIDYKLTAVNIDQGYSGFRQDVIEDYLAMMGVNFHMMDVNIARAVEEKSSPGSIACSLCSRLRRGSLYGIAEELGCNKIALGHHMDDFIETLLLNQFFVGRNASMAVKLKADDGKNMVIRPLVYVAEKDIIEYSKQKNFPIVCCQCPLACGEATFSDHKRRFIKDMISQLEEKIPFIRNSLIGAIGNVTPTHMLDKKLWNFE